VAAADDAIDALLAAPGGPLALVVDVLSEAHTARRAGRDAGEDGLAAIGHTLGLRGVMPPLAPLAAWATDADGVSLLATRRLPLWRSVARPALDLAPLVGLVARATSPQARYDLGLLLVAAARRTAGAPKSAALAAVDRLLAAPLGHAALAETLAAELADARRVVRAKPL
jgi:hypothetical protein